MADKDDDLLTQARERFKLSNEAEASQRQQEREDLRFQVPEQQWTPEARAARMGDTATGTPPRPMLSIDQLNAPRRLVRNQAQQAKLGVNIHPVSEEANEETAEALQGLYRRIERDSRANQARLWALDRAIQCGSGFYRVYTAYDEDAENPFDQEIRIGRILHQANVLLDPAATEADWSDGKYAFVAVWMSRDEFKRAYPEAKGARANVVEWEALYAPAPDWLEGDAVCVTEYWYKVVTKSKVEVGDQSREREDVEVYCAHITGAEVLVRPQLWPGRYIPLIRVTGEELQPFEGRRRFAGMVTNAKDGQRMFNYAASSLVEGMSLEPKAPFIGAAGAFENYETKWQQANVRNFPYLEYNPKMVDGTTPAPPPARAQVDGTRMQLAIMALQESGRFIQQTTAVHEPSLGRLSQEQRSGRAILALQQQADVATGDFISNLAEISMAYEARVVLDLIPHIYDRPGRVTRIIRGDDDSSEPIAVNAPFVAKDGRVEVPQPGQPAPEGAKHFDLAKGRYGISIDVGKSYQTRLQEGDEALTRIIEAAPQLLIPLGDVWFKYRDHPGAKEISKRLAKMREQQFPNIAEGEDGQPTPEQLQAQAQKLGQENQQLKQILEQASKEKEIDAAKQQATIAKAQMDNETKKAIAAADNETKLAIAGMESRMAALELMLKQIGAESDRVAAVEDREAGEAHEARMGALSSTERPQEPEAPSMGQE